MKTTGIVLLVLGVSLVLLLTAARLGGGGSGPFPATPIGVGLAAAGWKMIRMGRRAGSYAAPASNAARSGSAEPILPGSALSPYTAALPVSPDLAARMEAKWARDRRVVWWIGGGLALGFAAAGMAVREADPGGDGNTALLMLALVGLLAAAIVATVWKLVGERLWRRDREAGSFLRSTGPVTVQFIQGSALVQVGDQAFCATGPAVKVLRKLPVATVDHTPHAHLIFAVRDCAGMLVYQL